MTEPDQVQTTPKEKCGWSYDSYYDRWDTGCEDVIVLHNFESPFAYGFKYCPYCGKEAVEVQEANNRASPEADDHSNFGLM